MSRGAAYLDGELVDPSLIHPSRHKYVGMWRPPTNPFEKAHTYILCPCGQTLKYRHESDQHYRAGCLDIPQYVTIIREDSHGSRCEGATGAT